MDRVAEPLFPTCLGRPHRGVYGELSPNRLGHIDRRI